MSDRTELLHKINSNVNQYPYDTDLSVWHEPDYWEKISIQSRGDCDDYVMEKHWQCLENDIPLEDIRIGLCLTEDGGKHAVLVVSDPEAGGDWILDNRQVQLMTLDRAHGLGYKGVSLQKPGHWLWREWVI